MISGDPVAALEQLLHAVELTSQAQLDLLEALKETNRRVNELSEDVAGIANIVTRLAFAAARKDDVEASFAEITARIDEVHERALRELTRLHEGSTAP